MATAWEWLKASSTLASGTAQEHFKNLKQEAGELVLFLDASIGVEHENEKITVVDDLETFSITDKPDIITIEDE